MTRKTLTILFVTLTLPLSAYAIKSGPTRHGLKNFIEVMPGALYRGAGNGSRTPMSDSSLKALCEAGFDSAIYLYAKGPNKTLNCGSNTIEYKSVFYSNEKPILRKIYDTIQRGGGPIYPHCWYGVHASGYIAAVALRQFCGYSTEQAVSYWNDHVAPSIRYPKIHAKIRAFRPDPNLQLSSSQASRHCP